MRIACLQHASFEGPGNIARWAAERGHSLNTIRLFEGQLPPQPDQFDLLVVMGGPMSIHDEADYPWLVAEKQLITQCVERNKYILGVCLGSQLLANSLGSPVYRNRVKEIGWFPIRRREEASASSIFAGVAERVDVLHWHGETYDLPPGCIHLAESDGCVVQAFEHPSGLGLQFHFEVAAEGLEDLIRHCGNEIGTGPYEQLSQGIVSDERIHRDAILVTLFGILDGIERKIHHSRLARERASLLSRFRYLAASATSFRPLQESMVSSMARHLPHYNWAGFYMLDPDDPRMLVLGPYVGEPTTHVCIPVIQGICGAAVASGKTIVVDDVHADPRYLSCSIHAKSEIVVPIRARGNVVGEIDVDSHEPAAFGDADRVFLEEVARIAGEFIEPRMGRPSAARV